MLVYGYVLKTPLGDPARLPVVGGLLLAVGGILVLFMPVPRHAGIGLGILAGFSCGEFLKKLLRKPFESAADWKEPILALIVAGAGLGGAWVVKDTFDIQNFTLWKDILVYGAIAFWVSCSPALSRALMRLGR
jgi:hypothetical protein